MGNGTKKEKKEWNLVLLSAVSGHQRKCSPPGFLPRKFERLVVQTRSEMATRKKSSKERQDSLNATFAVSSVDSTSVGEKLFGQTDGDGDGDDGPVVFICGKCKLPVGDSLSWDGSEDEQNQIRLKRESGFIYIYIK